MYKETFRHLFENWIHTEVPRLVESMSDRRAIYKSLKTISIDGGRSGCPMSKMVEAEFREWTILYVNCTVLTYFRYRREAPTSAAMKLLREQYSLLLICVSAYERLVQTLNRSVADTYSSRRPHTIPENPTTPEMIADEIVGSVYARKEVSRREEIVSHATIVAKAIARRELEKDDVRNNP